MNTFNNSPAQFQSRLPITDYKSRYQGNNSGLNLNNAEQPLLNPGWPPQTASQNNAYLKLIPQNPFKQPSNTQSSFIPSPIADFNGPVLQPGSAMIPQELFQSPLGGLSLSPDAFTRSSSKGQQVHPGRFYNERPKTIAVIGSHEGGGDTRDIDGDGRNDLTDLEWSIELLQAEHPNARIIEYSGPTNNPENIGQQIDALNADMDRGLSADDVLLPVREMVAYNSFDASGLGKLNPDNITDAVDTIEPDRKSELLFNRIKAVFGLIEELAQRVAVHIPGGDKLGYVNEDGEETHFNLWTLAKGPNDYKSVDKYGKVEPYSVDNTLTKAEGKGELIINQYPNGFDINEDGRIDISMNDPRLSGKKPLADKFTGAAIDDVVINDADFEKIQPYLEKTLRLYDEPIPSETLHLLSTKLIPLEKMIEIGRLPAENKDALEILGNYLAIGEDGLVFGFRENQLGQIVYQPFKHHTTVPNAKAVNFMLGSDIAAITGINEKVNHIYHG